MLIIKILDLPPWLKNTAEKMTSLQMCRIKKITPHTGQTFLDRQLCFYVKKYLLVKKHQKVSFVIFQRRFMSSNFAAGALELMRAGQNL